MYKGCSIKLILKLCYFFLFIFYHSTSISQELRNEISIGVSYGIQIPGRQDLKFRYYQNGNLIKNIRTTQVRIDPTAVRNINITLWKKGYGLKLDYYSWEHMSFAEEFLTDERPPFYSVEQNRDAILINIIKHFSFPFANNRNTNSISKYTILGIGIGEALTEVEQGRTQWRGAFQVFGGLSIPITKKIALLTEFKLMLTKDADTLSNKDGWFVDTSGTPHLFRFGAHWDTKYHMLQIGLQWKIN